jgi:hypothetical protein
MLPEGVHCSDPLTCNPGDMETSSDAPDCSKYQGCYIKQLCASEIWCKHATDAGVDVFASATGIDAGSLDAEMWDASEPESGMGSIYVPSCGNGIIEEYFNEECDLGSLNGACILYQGGHNQAGPGSSSDAGCPLGSFDWSGTPVCNCPSGSMVLCTTSCQYPVFLP